MQYVSLWFRGFRPDGDDVAHTPTHAVEINPVKFLWSEFWVSFFWRISTDILHDEGIDDHSL